MLFVYNFPLLVALARVALMLPLDTDSDKHDTTLLIEVGTGARDVAGCVRIAW